MSTKPKKAVYWIRMEMAGDDMLAAHQKARRALMSIGRIIGVETVSMVTETELMRMIRNGITDARTERRRKLDEFYQAIFRALRMRRPV